MNLFCQCMNQKPLLQTVLIDPDLSLKLTFAHSQTLQGLLNDIDNQKSYRQQLLDYIFNSTKVNLTSPTTAYFSTEENEKHMNETVFS